MHNLKKALYCLKLVLISFFYFLPAANALEVTAIRFGAQGTAQRIVLDITENIDFRAMLEETGTPNTPTRLQLDIPRLSTSALTGRRDLPPLIANIRIAPIAADYTRISFLLNDYAAIRTAFLLPAPEPKQEQNSNYTAPHRLVIDLTPTNAANFEKHKSRPHGTLKPAPANIITPDTPKPDIVRPNKLNADTPSADKPSADKPTLPFATQATGIRLTHPLSGTDLPPEHDPRPLIMLDAGHGGRDSGAVGHNLLEKDITLAVTKAIKDALEATGRFRVALTRQDDRFISLNERVRIARRAEADLFVSIHADSVEHGGHNIQGASFYTLSANASDAASARLAARENKADHLAGTPLPQGDHDVTTILIDLAMRETTSSARKFAQNLSKTFKKQGIKTVPSPVRSAGFMVLQAPDIPSVLVELGFVSNAQEAQKLSHSAYQTDLAQTIAKAIETYFKE